MNYKLNYFKIIEKAKTRKNIDKYEIHHIVPKSLGGTDDEVNLVRLTPREHYIVHYLLWKFTIGKEHIKMAQAFFIMSKKRTLSAKAYQRLKEEICKPIICLQTLQIFSSISEGSLWLHNITKKNIKTINKNISAQLKGNRKSVYGYCFDFYDSKKEYSKVKARLKQIICLQTLKVFNSAREASEEMNISYKCISKSCINKSSTHGYNFEFYEENKKYIKKEMKKTHGQNNRKILCIETKQIFNSLNELAKHLNINRTTITKYIKNNKPYKGLRYIF